MILRNVAVRHGRRALAQPVTRTALRQLSTEVSTQPNTQQPVPTSSTMSLLSEASEAQLVSSATQKKQRLAQEGALGVDSAHEHRGSAWTRPHATPNSAMPTTAASQYAEFQRIQENTRKLGSQVERRYVPTELISNPPGPEDVTLELLMASQTHMGHSTSLWNPANSRYIYGVRDGIHIISLETTAAHLRRAARVVEEVAYKGGLILYVGTRKGQMEIVSRAAELGGGCHLFTKWTPGAITNRDVILRNAGTKVVDHKDRDLADFQRYLGQARPLMPDLVVCLNPLENYTLLYECGLKSIPTIGVIDTNVDPTWVTYTVPANDDSLRSMAVIGGVLGRAGERGQKRRRADAEEGVVPWKTPSSIVSHVNSARRLALNERKAVMGRIQSQIEGFSEEEQEILRKQYFGTELDVSEEDMLGMLGETATAEASETTAAAPGADGLPSLEEVEQHVTSLEAQSKTLQAELEAIKKN